MHRVMMMDMLAWPFAIFFAERFVVQVIHTAKLRVERRAAGMCCGRFCSLHKIGSGSYGEVFSARNLETRRDVAIKRCRKGKDFDNGERELMILRHLKQASSSKGKDRCVMMLEHFIEHDVTHFVFDLHDVNLFQRMMDDVPLSLKEISRFVGQLASALCFLKSIGLMHTDIKPENVVLCHDGTIKLIDFGSSCFVSERIDFYIQSIFYRSPEVVLGFKLGVEIDAWSLGVLAYEMFTSMPLFKTNNEIRLLAMMSELLGLHPNIADCRRTDKDALIKHLSLYESEGQTIEERLSTVAKTQRLIGMEIMVFRYLVSLVEGLLRYDCAERLTPEQVLDHPFVTYYHSASSE